MRNLPPEKEGELNRVMKRAFELLAEELEIMEACASRFKDIYTANGKAFNVEVKITEIE